mmetsp:Transcript_1660/g.6016  ORF Transcript_1660/g.6016 Transcript_1660/m.6016 type:complete len:216 (+) Transcript_1660:2500-3147(+)
MSISISPMSCSAASSPSSSSASAASDGTVPVISSVASAPRREARVGVALYPTGEGSPISSAPTRFDRDGTAPVTFSVSACSSSSNNAPMDGTSPVTSSMIAEALNVNVPVRSYTSVEFGVPKRPILARRDLPGVCLPSLFNAAFGVPAPTASGDTANSKSSRDGVLCSDGSSPLPKTSVAGLNSNVSVRSSSASADGAAFTSSMVNPIGTCGSSL